MAGQLSWDVNPKLSVLVIRIDKHVTELPGESDHNRAVARCNTDCQLPGCGVRHVQKVFVRSDSRLLLLSGISWCSNTRRVWLRAAVIDI